MELAFFFYCSLNYAGAVETARPCYRILAHYLWKRRKSRSVCELIGIVVMCVERGDDIGSVPVRHRYINTLCIVSLTK